LLCELGVIDKFSKKVEGVESSNQFLTTENETHYFFAWLFTGKTLASDNGYVVYANPKSIFTLEMMHEFVNAQWQRIAPHSKSIHSAKLFSPTSSEN
jgi:hypothetical protein